MVRGNWQRRVERTEARRTAAKLQKEHRRNKRNSSAGAGGDVSDSKASFDQLEGWLDEKGDDIGVLLDDSGGVDIKDGAGSHITVDIWTDARPENRPEYLPNPLDDDEDFNDLDEEDGRNAKGRSKSKKEKSRGGFKKSKGKAHPNAKNKSSQETDPAVRERSGSISHRNNLKDERLCGKEFFFGKDKCKGTHQFKQQRQKGRRNRGDSIGGEEDAGCSFQHYHQLPKGKRKKNGPSQTPPMTLSQVLNENFQSHHIQHCNNDDSRPTASLPGRVREATLKSSFNALVGDVNDAACMDMIFHTRFSVNNELGGSNSDSDDSNESDKDDAHADTSADEYENKQIQNSKIQATLTEFLEQENLPSTSIVYLTIQGVLVYDRHRGGLILTEKEERFLLFGDAIDDIVDEDISPDNEERDPIHIHEQLTHHLLDEILSFCGDESTAVLPQVCTSWHDEVGTRSPLLWEMLLGRHEWPLSVNGDESTLSDDVLGECRRRRDAFTSNYKVARDVRALTNACTSLCAGSAGSNVNNKHRFESAMQIFKATKGAPTFHGNGKDRCIVKIWSNESGCTRALAAYQDFTLRLFEVDPGSSSSNAQESSNVRAKTNIKCRQIVCVRAAPPSISRKKDCCELMSMDLDDNVVACFFVEPDLDVEGLIIPWMTVLSRDDVVCAGNEGMLEDDCIQSFSLRETILDFLLDSSHETELQEGLHNYLAISDGDTSDVSISVTEKLIACGRGHFLFHAYIHIPDHRLEYFGHRLFLFSTRTGSIVTSHQLGNNREGTSLFASRPFKHRTNASTGTMMCTNILVCGPTEAVLFISVEISRDHTADIMNKSMIENNEFAPWSKMEAALTSSHAIFSTDPVQGPFLHIQGISTFDSEGNISVDSSFVSIGLGGRDCKLHNIFIIRDHYVAAIISNGSNDEEEFDGQWFGINEASCEIIIYHIHTYREIHRSPIPSEYLSVDCIGDTLAMNVSKLGFCITGENARDVAEPEFNENAQTMTSPSGKTPKTKKKRLASLASGRKKDGFARGMSLRG